MGVAKAALESVNRYLARDLGPAGDPRQPRLGRPARDAGCLRDPRLRRISPRLARRGAARLGRSDPTPVADAALFLLSDLARAISGEILHADGGASALVAMA